MEEYKNLEQNLDKSNEKLHISDVMCSKLSKDESVIVLYDDGEEFFSVDINKDYGEYIGKFDGDFLFQKELDSLNIKLEYDEHIYYGDKSINQLKKELINRGFKVEIR